MATSPYGTRTHAPMNAITARRYGAPIDVCVPENIPVPEIKDGHVLLRVHAASVTAGDWHMIRGTPFPARFIYGGPLKPRRIVPGSDVCGAVVEVGNGVDSLTVGTLVIAELALAGLGAFAEYALAPARVVIPVEPLTNAADAACIPVSGTTALQGLRDHANVKEGDHVLITGAAGGVGSFAVQIARAFGATVTAVCKTGGVRAVEDLGAHRVIDRTKQDVTRVINDVDVVFDCAAFRPPSAYLPILRPGGRYICVGGTMLNLSRASVASLMPRRRDGKTIKMFMQRTSTADLALLRDMVAGGLIKPLIHSVLPLDKAGEGVDVVERGLAVGKVVLLPGR